MAVAQPSCSSALRLGSAARFCRGRAAHFAEIYLHCIMNIIAQIIVALIAIEHLYILYMEMFAWETLGKKTFKGALPNELFKPTKTLAANQGLYNGFLSAGLLWSLLISNPQWQIYVAIFFLSCVFIAGLYGAFTASKKIFFVQALPALIGLIVVHL
jgi:putative membrane protein